MKRIRLFFAMSVLSFFVLSCGNDEPVVTGNDNNATVATIMQRKSVRSYTNDTIASDVMESILRAAMAAPSGMDVRPWHLVVMTDKSVYDTLFAGNFNMDKFKQAAAVVILCADTTVTRAPRENPDAAPETRPNRIWRDDMGACTENLLLAVESYGLGAVWTACYPFEDRMTSVRDYLNLPGTVVPYAVVPIGYPAGDEQPKDKWDTSRVHHNRW